MSVDFTPWPEEFAQAYRDAGYWQDLSLVDIVARHQTIPEYYHKNAIICGERQFSYQDIDRLSDQLALQLRNKGVHAGQTAVVQLPNVAEFYLVFFALLKLGVVAVNALFRHQQVELTEYVEQTKPNLMIVAREHPLFGDAQFAHQLEQRMRTPCHWLVLHSNHTLTYGTDSITSTLSENWLAERDDVSGFWASLSTESERYWVSTPPDEVAFFQLSGGSTGTPKLIPRTHNDYYYSVRASAEVCELDTSSIYLCALPAAHNFSLSSPGALGVFYVGGTVVLARDPSAETCFPLIARHGVTIAALVPPAVSLWLKAVNGQTVLLKSLQWLQVGGAKLSEAVARQIEPRLQCRLQQVFGMAEGLVNYTRRHDDEWHTLYTQGRPLSPADEVKIVNTQGELVKRGEIGALWTRGPYTFRGYFNSPEHNLVAFDQDGFYCCGDLVKQTESGHLIVVGRDKDQINRGGEKIAAEEVENYLLRFSAVTHAALVAMPDRLMGEKSCAFIVTSDPALKAVKLRKHLRSEGLADFKFPDRFEFVQALPMTAVGKVDKKRLRQWIERTLSQPHSVKSRSPATVLPYEKESS